MGLFVFSLRNMRQRRIAWPEVPGHGKRHLTCSTTVNRNRTARADLAQQPQLPQKVKVSNAQMKALNLKRLPTCPDWRYTIRPLSHKRGP
jgi:hypothetical protein